ncbi:iron-siderophore ABC transporter substrate-binding protein [Saccharospirillum salsuginis]|uniref:ABC transporter substrate-binding protein n=1 Tax=Saccharospirillum salsuginis TaxID=418750 RepID=A0A918K8N6_9GAMM|nr:iron-siderophore ABC transporter substrate-binding protein [Saccharospirillum salsuginis]GGX54954.1 ABC transporter substrate-binding protein [Saccharospirillum salsuginis]
MRKPYSLAWRTAQAITAAILFTVATAQADTVYPLTLEHKFGTSVIPEQPERVATVDYAGGDNLLAFGYQPLTVRYWFGEYDNAVWPWARPLLESEPEVIRGELNYEQIAKTNPDVILAIRSGITREDYEQLSKIAPVVAVPEGVGDYSLTWQERARMVGRMLNQQDEAETRIAAIEDQLAAVEAAHPEWAGKTFAMATYWNGVGVYSAEDTGVILIENMGLTVQPAVEDMTEEGEFYISLSEEKLPLIDADVLFWYTTGEARQQIESLALRPRMRAYQEGREIFLPGNSIRNGALSYSTLLSLPKAIETMTPLIERAVDGDPGTEVSGPIDS